MGGSRGAHGRQPRRPQNTPRTHGRAHRNKNKGRGPRSQNRPIPIGHNHSGHIRPSVNTASTMAHRIAKTVPRGP
eukprot:3492412-Pyramimonas_sp.AAC.1